MSDPVQDKRDRSVGDLVEQMSQDTRELVRAEVALARAELVASARRLSLSAALALAAFGALVAAAILGLATAISAWLAALVVALALVLAGAGAMAVGVRIGRRSLPPVPAETVDSIKEDVAWVKTRARSGMR
jgi:hypothetical protein